MDFHFPNYQVGPHAVPAWLKHKACKGKLPKVLDVGNKLRTVVTHRYAPFLAKSKSCQIAGATVSFVVAHILPTPSSLTFASPLTLAFTLAFTLTLPPVRPAIFSTAKPECLPACLSL